jgi:bacterioferritin-associated ferredoxin
MKPEEDICVCHHVSLNKLKNFIKRENPEVPSQLSECLGAGTSCGWCIPFLKKIHGCHVRGQSMDLTVSFENYAERRKQHNMKKSIKKADDPT